MDLDEYEYLEKTVENPDLPSPAPAAANGTKPDDKDSTRSTEERSSSRHLDKSPSRHRERSLSRHRERSPSRHRERSPSRRRERSPSRHRERSPSRHRERSSSRHHSDGDRVHRSGREHRDDRDRVRERERRSRSRSERRREEERRERSRELRERELERRERSRELRERELERRERSRELRERELRDRDRDSRRYKEKKEEVAEPEADPERDQRTVFAFQIALKADERDVYEFFSRAGKVRDVRLIMDRNSRRSKGVGYIEFYDALSVPMAIALSGQPLLGQPVMVKPSEAEKNLVQSTTAVAGVNGFVGPYSGGARRLYIGNLHFNITEEQLRLVFEPFGPVELVQLPRELETGHCKGYGFIQFQRLEDARAALSLNGQLEIAGRSIKVSTVSDQVGMQDVGTNAGDFDDDEGGGLSLNAQSRALLMQKLDRTGTATSVPGALLPPVVNAPVLSSSASVLGVPAVVSPLLQAPSLLGLQISSPPVVPTAMQPVDAGGTPSECLLLKNMFDPTVESDPDFDLDIREDVEDECTKYGTIKHIFVDKNTAGHVYLRFDSTSSAMSAQRALQGRWFAGKMIMATFMTPQNYEAKFPICS